MVLALLSLASLALIPLLPLAAARVVRRAEFRAARGPGVPDTVPLTWLQAERLGPPPGAA